MGKFNKTMINGMDKGLQLGQGLLSETSRKMGTPRVDDIYWLHLDEVEPNPKNKMSQSDIEEMAELIKLAGGIEQNLVGYRLENGKVRLTTGERRYRGAKWLLEHGEGEYLLPTRIKDYKEYDFPVDDDLKEQFAIHITNKYRDKTDGDKLEEIQFWTEFIKQLRASGMETLQLKDDNQNVISELQISGRKTREIISEVTNETQGQVQRYEQMMKPENKVLADAILEGNLNLSGAEAVKELPEGERKEFIERNAKKARKALTGKDVKGILKEEGEKIKVSAETFKKEMEDIIQSLENGIEISEDDYKTYQKCIQKLRKIVGGAI